MEAFLIYALVGSIAGTIGGLMGIGGGLIIVPALAWIFRAHGFAEASIMHLAIGTSLATIIPTSISSMWTHHQHGAVRWPVFFRLLPGFAMGALIGGMTAGAIASGILRLCFGVFLSLVGAHLAFGSNPAPHRNLPGTSALFLVGTAIGTLSALVGIGGGNLTVPFLLYCNVSIRQAVATGAAAGLPIATIGTATFVVAGQDVPDLPAWSSGYCYGPAWLGIAATSVLFAPLGAKLAHRIPTPALKRGFGVVLIIVGLRMLLR